MKIYHCLGFLIIFLISCFESNQKINSDRTVLVELGNKKLYASDLEKIIHPEVSIVDSIAIANAFIDQWIREQLLSNEASKRISSDFAIEEMVEDYRQKLIKNNYEMQIVRRRLDTLVTTSQLEEYYNTVKDQHLLNEPIVRFIYAKIPKKESQSTLLTRALENNDFSTAFRIMDAIAIEKINSQDEWHEWSEIGLFHKDFTTSKAKQLSLQEKSDKEFKYFLKVTDFVDDNQAAPLSYIASQLKMVIVYQRQQKIIDELKQELYDRALETNLIKIL